MNLYLDDIRWETDHAWRRGDVVLRAGFAPTDVDSVGERIHGVIQVLADGKYSLCCDSRYCEGECGLPQAVILIGGDSEHAEFFGPDAMELLRESADPWCFRVRGPYQGYGAIRSRPPTSRSFILAPRHVRGLVTSLEAMRKTELPKEFIAGSVA